MKPLYQRLEDTGVELGKHVIFLIEKKGETKSWRATKVALVRVLTELPSVDKTETNEHEYNPTKHLLLAIEDDSLSGEDSVLTVIMLTFEFNSVLYEIEGSGFVFENNNTRCTVGQTTELFTRFRQLTGNPTLQ